MKIFTALSFCVLLVIGVQAQSQQYIQLAKDHLTKEAATLGLKADDVQELRFLSATSSSHNEVTHLYFIQQFRGVDIYNAIYNASVKDGKVILAGNRLKADIAGKIGRSAKKLSPGQAVSKALSERGVALRSAPRQVSVEGGKYTFSKEAIAVNDFIADLVYIADETGTYNLTWLVEFELQTGHDLWNIAIDAGSGKVSKSWSLTAHCNFNNDFLAADRDDCSGEELSITTAAPVAGDGASYNVVKFPNESPKHEAREVIVDPADIDASPFGWHDTDGVDGGDLTNLQGNNVHAYSDRDNNNTPDGGQPDGGAELVFDFAFDEELEPVDYQHASTTNMFYAVNFMHDFGHHYGFDEESGNFQLINYTGASGADDYVVARNQASAGLPTPSLNNASFGTPADGGNGRMQMFEWESGANQLLTVNEPASVAGKYTTTTTSDDWGGAITDVPITGEVVIVNDGTGQGTLGCNSLVNGDDITGKIAMIDRGVCEFGLKGLNAQNEGAIAVIICNHEEQNINMGAGAVGAGVTIPMVMISRSDCDKIRVFAGQGLTVSFVNEATPEGPVRLDAGFDNGIIAHEFGHGISNRLTGGKDRAGCLTNYDTNDDGTADQGEQMGEGWSDFFTLVTTVKPGDKGEMRRGIGTYADSQEPDGNGIRHYPYSTDMSINPLTYDDIVFESLPHGIGTVWCSMIWDLYWALSDEYGWDPDIFNGIGGNNLAIQLVMDGMKMQPCNPGFIDARNAILEADSAMTGGDNGQTIWEVFARRGLGWSARQGVESLMNDGKEAFDLPPFLIKEVVFKKESSQNVDPGGEYTVTLTVTNYTEETVTNVLITDAFPENTSFVDGSISQDFEVNEDIITITVGEVAAGETVEINYNLLTSDDNFSDRVIYDDMETDEVFNKWDLILDDGSVLWTIQDIFVNSGSQAWFFENQAAITDASLINIQPITIDASNPVLRFYHNYETEAFFDAGILMASTDGGDTYYPIGADKFFRNTYSGKVGYSLYALVNQRAFYGSSNGWIASYVDLSDFIGEDVIFRFRFASDDNLGDLGWGIDDFEVLDAKYYNTTACLTSDQTEEICRTASERGTFINFNTSTSTEDIAGETLNISVYPNPNRGKFNIQLSAIQGQEVNLTLTTLEGTTVWNQKLNLTSGNHVIPVQTQNLPGGFYVLQMEGSTDRLVRKVMIH